MQKRIVQLIFARFLSVGGGFILVPALGRWAPQTSNVAPTALAATAMTAASAWWVAESQGQLPASISMQSIWLYAGGLRGRLRGGSLGVSEVPSRFEGLGLSRQRFTGIVADHLALVGSVKGKLNA